MKISVEFESIEEFEAFRTSGKATRTKKEKDADEAAPSTNAAPAPLQPPAQGVQTFNPTTAPNPFAATQTAPPAGRTVDPAVQALVDKISARTTALAAGGSDQTQMLNWYRSECTKAGADATNATMEQILTVLLPRMSAPALENIVKLIGA